MCSNTKKRSANTVSSIRRRKLWDTHGFQCSIIGTCLSRTEIRKLATKKVYGLSAGLKDHEIHSTLVNRASKKCPESRALQRVLENKYKTIIHKFSKVKTEEALLELWAEYLKSGSIAGAYWAVLTHPALTNDTAYDVHGEIHMIGHDSTAKYQQAVKQLSEVRQKLESTECELKSDRTTHAQEKADLETEITALRTEKNELEKQAETVTLLQKRIDELEEKASASASQQAIKSLNQENALLRDENLALKAQIQQLTMQIDTVNSQYEQEVINSNEVQKKNEQLLDENHQLQQELHSFEDFLSSRMMTDSEDNQQDCENCEINSDFCPQALDGKTVLYVGGRYKMVPRYKQLVEQYGGTFLYHDGGLESARHILPKFLTRADAVFCPVDCVSHDACKCVKKMCKRYQKDYVMMRSSGLSSLARGLQNLVQ